VVTTPAVGRDEVTPENFEALAAEVDAEWQHILDNGGRGFLAAIDEAVLGTDYDEKETP